MERLAVDHGGSMPNITVTFTNAFGQSRLWVIRDLARDPNSPPVVFNDFLDAGGSTPALTLGSSDGLLGNAVYQRSDGAPQIVTPSDQDEVQMS